jgi:hypothetical protein
MQRHTMTRAPRTSAGIACAVIAGMLLSALSPAAIAAPRDQAKRIHDRLIGTPPSEATLTQMAALINGTNDTAGALLAANLAIDRNRIESSPFYNVTLKNFATPWTNRDQTVFAPLNDYTATVIGMVRDEVPFNTVLSEDILYAASSGGAPAYSPANNDHYQYLEDNHVDLRTALQQTTQSSLSGLPPAATAGVMTSRAASQAFFVLGTNRAMFRFTMLNHMCRDLEQVHDTSRPPDRIRQDVTRSPGGDSRLFLNNCVGCHSGMDPMAQSFAYYNFDETAGRLVYTQGQVQPKYLINSDNFKSGYVTPDDHWDNYWRSGQNSLLGWSQSLPGKGQGAKSLGQELGGSDAFAQCQVEKVFRNVCFRSPSDAADRGEVQRIVGVFKNGNYSLKNVFAETAVYCRGD